MSKPRAPRAPRVETPRARVPAPRRRAGCSHAAYDNAAEASSAAARAEAFRDVGRALWGRCQKCDKYYVWFNK